VELSAATGAGDQVTLSGTAGALTWDASLLAQGRYVDVWDGADGDGSTIAFTGLGSLDLTSAGASNAFRMLIGTDHAGATARLRVYTDATHWSEQTVIIPNTPSNELIYKIPNFTTGGGAAGPATFSNVGAMELQVDTSVNGTDGQVTFLGMLGPTVKTQDFTNPADLSLTKIVDNANPTVGQNVTYTLTLTNGGPGAANNISVTDVLPAGMTFVSSTPSGTTSYNSASGVWSIASLNSGGIATLAITATVTTQGTHTNTGEVTDVDEFDPDSTPNNQNASEDDQASVPLTATQIDLALTKIVNNASPNVGDQVTFTVTASNTGPSAATGVLVSDALPAGLTFVSATPSGSTTYNSGTGVWTIGSLNSSGTAQLQIVATVATSGAKTNTAEVTAANESDLDSTPNNHIATEDDQASIIVTPQVADLSLTKTVDIATPNKNQNVTFTLTLSNAGPNSATSVQVTDLLPAGLTFVSSTPSGTTTYTSGTGIWNVGTLASGANATLAIVATTTTSGAKTNSAQVTAVDQFDPDSTKNNNVSTEDDQASVVVTPNVADLSLTKQVNNANPNANANVVFSVTLTNGGPQSATNVTVADPLPAGMTFVSSTPSGTTTYNSGTGVWTVGTLASGASATLQITATVTTQGVKTNIAQVSTSDPFDPDSTPGNSIATEDDQASAVVTPNATDLSLTKTVDNAAPALGDNVTFTVTVTNNGPLAASGVLVSDQLPAGLTFVSSTPSGTTTYNSATGVWSVGALASGASATLSVVATVGTAGTFNNRAQISAMNEFDTDSTPGNSVATEDDQASVSVVLDQQISPRLCVTVWHR
jgi:uncharacterized repeat protein (TIGR01451 family)